MKTLMHRAFCSMTALALVFALAACKPNPPDQQPTPTPSGQLGS